MGRRDQVGFKIREKKGVEYKIYRIFKKRKKKI
jgi:hypothetical protein